MVQIHILNINELNNSSCSKKGIKRRRLEKGGVNITTPGPEPPRKVDAEPARSHSPVNTLEIFTLQDVVEGEPVVRLVCPVKPSQQSVLLVDVSILNDSGRLLEMSKAFLPLGNADQLQTLGSQQVADLAVAHSLQVSGYLHFASFFFFSFICCLFRSFSKR